VRVGCPGNSSCTWRRTRGSWAERESRRFDSGYAAMDMGGNRLLDLQSLGQSIWLDEFHRGMLGGSRFARWVNRDGISGVTSSPAILAKAFAEDAAYREGIAALRAAGATGRQIYDRLRIEDAVHAADLLRHVYDCTEGRDGYVSIQVSPDLADDADATVSEALGLWNTICKPNVMIKVPATDNGVLAIRRLIAEGVNINATLIFGTRRYREVAEAYLSGLEDRASENLPLQRVASVAGLLLSRIDTWVDKQLDAIQSPAQTARAQRLRGRTAVTIARVAYREYKGLIASHRWRALAACEARPQRLLWANTCTQDARYPDVKYVNEVIGRDTVGTMTVNTLNAYRDRGAAAPTLERDPLDAAALLAEIPLLGIDLDRVGRQLECDGIAASAASVNDIVTQLASRQTAYV
jgi:transaldolase